MAAPEKVPELIAQLTPFVALATEVQLADFGETASGGPYSKFRHADPDELDLFRGKERVGKNRAGTRYHMLLIEIADDESAVDQEKRERVEAAMKGGPISKNAAMLCKEDGFQVFIVALIESDSHMVKLFRPATVSNKEALATQILCFHCGIESRAELDHNKKAKQRFGQLKSMYLRWQAEQ